MCENVCSPHGIGVISGEMIVSISISTTNVVVFTNIGLEERRHGDISGGHHRRLPPRVLESSAGGQDTTPHRPPVTGHGPSRHQFTPTDRAE